MSSRMERRVRSRRRLPLAAPRGESIRPAGPQMSRCFFQAHRAYPEIPTMVATLPVGRPERCQVLTTSSRCWRLRLAVLADSAFTKRWPRGRGRARVGTTAGSAKTRTGSRASTRPSPTGSGARGGVSLAGRSAGGAPAQASRRPRQLPRAARERWSLFRDYWSGLQDYGQPGARTCKLPRGGHATGGRRQFLHQFIAKSDMSSGKGHKRQRVIHHGGQLKLLPRSPGDPTRIC
jgi:hypothetical protein